MNQLKQLHWFKKTSASNRHCDAFQQIHWTETTLFISVCEDSQSSRWSWVMAGWKVSLVIRAASPVWGKLVGDYDMMGTNCLILIGSRKEVWPLIQVNSTDAENEATDMPVASVDIYIYICTVCVWHGQNVGSEMTPETRRSVGGIHVFPFSTPVYFWIHLHLAVLFEVSGGAGACRGKGIVSQYLEEMNLKSLSI